MKKTDCSGSNNKPTSNHYHPRTREVSVFFGFLGNILQGMFGPLLDPLRCFFQGHDPEPFYKEAKYTIHTHRCSRCHAPLGLGRMKWHSIPPPPPKSGEEPISLEDWHFFATMQEQDLRRFTEKQYEAHCQDLIQKRASSVRSKMKFYFKAPIRP